MSGMAGSYTSDVFRIWYYKRTPCARKDKHEWAACAFAHPGERANRRDPRTHGPTLCNELEKTGECPMGDTCPNAHSVFEAWLHPLKYRTQLCSDGIKCTRNLCFFAHSSDELRTDTSTPSCPPEYNQVMSRSAPFSTSHNPSTTGRHGQYSSQGGISNYQYSHGSASTGHRNAAGSFPASSNSAPVAGNTFETPGDHNSSNGSSGPLSLTASHSAPPTQQYRSSGPKLPVVQVRVSDSGSSQQQQQHARSSAGGTTASPNAASTPAAVQQQQQPGPGMYMNMAMLPAPLQLLPVGPVPAGYAAAAATAAYGAVYAPAGGGMPAAVYVPSPAYMAPPSSGGSTTAAAPQVQPQPQQQSPQRHGTGVYVPVGSRLQHMQRSASEGSSGRQLHHQQQALSTAGPMPHSAGLTRGQRRGSSGGVGVVSSRSNISAIMRNEQHKAADGKQPEDVAATQHEEQRLTHDIAAATAAAVTEQLQNSSSLNNVPIRQTSAEAAAAAAAAALSAPLHAGKPAQQPQQQQQEQQMVQRVKHPQPVSNGSRQLPEIRQQQEQQDAATLLSPTSQAAALHLSNAMQHDIAESAAAPISTLVQESADDMKLRKMRDMLRAALQELSITKARAQAAEARIAAAESYMTKSALQAYAAVTAVAKAEAGHSKQAAAPAATAPAVAADAEAAPVSTATANQDVTSADDDEAPACVSAAGDDAISPAVASNDDAGQPAANAADESAGTATAVVTVCADQDGHEGMDDTTDGIARMNPDEEDNADADASTADEGRDMQQLAELLPVSTIVLADAQMLLPLPRAMTPADVGSLLRAGMMRAGANEVQVRTAEVMIQAQLVAMRQSQAEMQRMQAELTNALRTAQDATGERDKLETKYKSYKAATKQHLSEKHALQKALAKAQHEAQEAQASAASAWAAVSQVQQKDSTTWADAVSDSDG